MSLWSRIANVFRPDRLGREIDDELASHIQEAIDQGRNLAEARRAFGSALKQREESRDLKLIPWLDSIRADAVFGLRQLRKKKVTSAAAILSLALAIGACTAAFRLIDALLLRPLPVKDPERLYALSRVTIDDHGKLVPDDSVEYPLFRQMRAAVKGQAELIAISWTDRMDLTYASDREMEKAHVQYVSGWMFGEFGLQPALGRLFTENDDLQPGAHPYAVLSHDYWASRFGQDPKVIGRTFRLGRFLYTIVGVAEERFTGTETGTVTDIFLPTMMHFGVRTPDRGYFRTLVLLRPGVAAEPVRDRLRAAERAVQEERAKGYPMMPKQRRDQFINHSVLLEPAAAGRSNLQKDYRRSLAALGVLVALVLLIACANVANLMTAQAAVRAREMALRVSIGAGRWRLVQLVLIESALLALLAAVIGALFAWWSAPFVVRMINPPDNPARLVLPADWRVLGFGLALTLAVTFLFGLIPALRASAVKPASALKGGEDPQSRGRLMHTLIAVQVAFCFLVLFVAGLFVATFQRLSNQPTGFSAERLLTLDTIAQGVPPPVAWDQMAEHLRAMPGIEAVAISNFALLSGHRWSGLVSINGAPPGEDIGYFLDISPGWIDTMKIALIAGRDLRASDTYPGATIVNETFAKQFFNGENPVGKTVQRVDSAGKWGDRLQIVGLVRDARYLDIRGANLAVGYVPFHWKIDPQGPVTANNQQTFAVRTSSPDPLAMASILRKEVPAARPEFRVSNIRTQKEINQSHTVRERLLAMLALFFAAVALLLAGVGLYGVLDYSVLQRRREIGIRMAIGAQAGGIARLVTVEVFSMVLVGAFAGLALGMASVRYIESLFYQVKPTDVGVLALPSLAILVAALLAALPAVVRAVRIDPVAMLRAD
jgi:predicted permease